MQPVAIGLQNRLIALQNRIQSFSERGENWNGYDVAAPDPAAIAHAVQWIGTLFDTVLRRSVWQEPIVGPDENGNIVFEWQRGERWLCITVSADAAAALREGDLPTGESGEGQADTPQQRETLWTWLMA